MSSPTPSPTIDFDLSYAETYTETITEALGPCSTGRSLLDTNSAHYIYLAPNGNDGSAGTSPATAKLTLAGAVAALGGARTCIHIIRNGYVGTLSFTIGADQTIPASNNIQVELGEVADFTSAAGPHGIILADGAGADGFFLYITTPSSSPNGMRCAKNATIRNCQIINNGQALYAGATTAGGTVTLTGCVLIDNLGGNAIIDQTNGFTITATRCVFFGDINIIADAIHTHTFTRCIFVNNNYTSTSTTRPCINANNVANSQTINLNACTFYNWLQILSAGALSVIPVTLNYCYALPKSNYNGTIPAGVSFTITNPVSPTTPPYYRNFNLALNGTITPTNTNSTGWKLQQLGASTGVGTAKYLINSPLVSAYGVGPADISPWTITVTLASRAWASSTKFYFPPSSMKRGRMWVNPTMIKDIAGNSHKDYDGYRREWELTFGEGSFYAKNDDFKRLLILMADKGTLKMYPLGAGVTNFINPNTGVADATAGTFSNTDNSFAPTIISGIAMLAQNWQGWWIVINNGGDKHYYINTNDGSKWYLTDPLSNGFPANGSYSFRIDYITVQAEIKDIEQQFQQYAMGYKGNSDRETANNQTLPYEGRNYSIKFFEKADLEEAS